MYGKKYIVDRVKAPHSSFKVTPIKQMRIESSEEISSWAGVKLGYPSFWFMPSICYYVVLVKVGKWENGSRGVRRWGKRVYLEFRYSEERVCK